VTDVMNLKMHNLTEVLIGIYIGCTYVYSYE
jgi:hypothetical protein